MTSLSGLAATHTTLASEYAPQTLNPKPETLNVCRTRWRVLDTPDSKSQCHNLALIVLCVPYSLDSELSPSILPGCYRGTSPIRKRPPP